VDRHGARGALLPAVIAARCSDVHDDSVHDLPVLSVPCVTGRSR
jgi:hypothetical protein